MCEVVKLRSDFPQQQSTSDRHGRKPRHVYLDFVCQRFEVLRGVCIQKFWPVVNNVVHVVQSLTNVTPPGAGWCAVV